MYLDTAILVKLLTDEPETEFFVDAIAGKRVSTSELAIAEVWSALLSKERLKLIRRAQRKEAWEVFQDRVQQGELRLHPLDSVVLRKATFIMERCHPRVALRTLDAIHTASCDLSQHFPLCTTDRRIRDAATLLGIPLFPPPGAAILGS